MPGRRRNLRLERAEQRVVMDAGLGVTAQYYSDAELTTLVATRVEPTLDQNWAGGVPVAGLNADQFSARYTGQIEAQSTGLHTFHLSSEVGARLWINGRQLFDRWTDVSIAGAAAQLELIAGRKYDVQLEIRETTGLASVQLQWSSSALPLSSIPTGSLFASERGFVERRVWDSVAGNSVAALTTRSTYPNRPASSTLISNLAVGNTSRDQFGQLITGLLRPPITGNYRFYIAGDETAELWLSNSASPMGKERIALVASPTAARDWTATPEQQSLPIRLVAGQAYAIEVIHKESTGADHVAVGWRMPGASSIQVISGQFLSPPLATVEIFSKQPDAVEGSSTPIEFTVTRTGPLTNPLTVSYRVGGSATPGSDYQPLPGTITIPARVASARIVVNVLPDTMDEATEHIQIELLDGPRYVLGLPSQRTSQATIQNVADAVPGGVVVTPAILLTNFDRFGAVFSQLDAAEPYQAIIQASVTTVPANRSNAQLRLPYNRAVQEGDVLWVEFYVRSINGPGRITVVSESNDQSYVQSLDRGMPVTNQWTRVQLPFTSLETCAAGDASLAFFIGSQVQTLQFADIVVRNYGPGRNITPQLPWLNNIGGTFGFTAGARVAGESFNSAVEITTVTQPGNGDSWRLQYGGRNSTRVRSGDRLLLEFDARATQGTAPRMEVVVQTTSNFATLSSQPLRLTDTWQRFRVNTVVAAGYDREGLQAMLNVGFGPQVVQVANLRWTNLSARIEASDLPELIPATTYGGRGPTDAWRTAADARIALERQSTLTVNVVDTAGRPVDGAVVSLQQTRHSFMFGSAVDGYNNLLNSSGGPDALRYQSEIKRLFNVATIENSLKWPNFLSNRQLGINTANWVVNQGLALRGHNVIWPDRTNMPDSVWDQYDAIAASDGSSAAANYLRRAIQSRIRDSLSTFADLAGQWDIVNEPYANRDVMDILGDQVVVDWFVQARQVDPDVQRVLNEYDIFSRNGNNRANRADFDQWLTRLVAADAIERMGEQSHYNESTLTDIPVLGQLIQTYQSQFNLPIVISEFDVESPNRQLQADYLRDYMTMAFSQGAVDEFILWGFWSKAHWKPVAALYDDDFTIRPNGQVYEDLVFGDWWTDTRGTTRDGAFSADVFEGNYVITVSHGNHTVQQSLSNFTTDGSVTIVVNQLPVIANQTFTVNENSSSSPGRVIASDSDVEQTLTYSIVQGNFGNTFQINPDTGVLSIQNATALNYESRTAFALTIRVTDDGAPSQSSEARVFIQLVDLPELIGNVVIGDGTAQRSMLDKVVLTFDGPVNLEVGALTVDKRGLAGPVPTQATQTINAAGQGVVTLTFSGALTRGNGSLEDGYYQLVIDGSKIRRDNQGLDLNRDGVGNDTRTFGSQAADRFFAIFGDTNGDGFVSTAEFALFRATFGSSASDAAYNELFDYERDRAVGTSDLTQIRLRLGRPRLPFV